MDLNHVLLWLGGGSCLVALVSLAGRARSARSWLLATALVLAAQGAAYLAVPAYAGFVSAALFVLFVFAPMSLSSLVMRLLGRERFAVARRLSWLVRVLHPSHANRDLPHQIEVLEQLHRDGVLDQRTLAALPASSAIGRFVRVQALRSAGSWGALRAFIAALPEQVRATDVTLAVHEVRALAELGELDAMLAAQARIEADPALAGVRSASRLIVAARLGRVDLVHRLLQGPAAHGLRESSAEYWRAVAMQVSGDPAAEPRLQALTAREPEIAHVARQRLAQPFAPLDLSALSPVARATLQHLTREIESAAGLTAMTGRRTASRILLASFVIVFAFELRGGTTDTANLIELGALVIPRLPGYDQLWRLLTAAWLHFGALHLCMNGLALWSLGRPIEATFGPVRMFVLFVLSALAGNLAALQLLSGPTILVGASGGVLGMLGALVGVTLLRLRKMPTQYLRQQLRSALSVIVLQAAFDFSTPSVSSIAHAFGFGAGLLLGALLVPKQR